MELMAPAGGPDAAYAALHYGADAVYVGMAQFSARADCENFTPEQLDALTAYAHQLQPRRKVFLALNTLVLERELPSVVENLDAAVRSGVDAVIVQDLGVYRMARRYFPGLRLHASTQMAIHNRAGVEMLRDMGFARVTLAREVSPAEIRAVAELPGIETEVFVHGALCYSYSGLCLFSSLRIGRSGNRGRCAYLCRDAFAAPDGRSGFLFSMKDLALADALPELRAAGVASLKIEGRKKSPLYVAAVTRYYRRLLEGGVSPAERAEMEADIRTIFSRPWTALSLPSRSTGAIDPEFVGHRGTPTGRVEEIVRRGAQRFLRFQTRRSLEVHDGLQLDLPGGDKPFGFAVESLAVLPGSRRVFEAAAGARVEIPLPPDAPDLPRQAEIFHASSQAVKRKYIFDRPKPGQFSNRQALDIRCELAPGRVGITARTAAGAHVQLEYAGDFKPAREPGAMAAAARGAFEKLGDTAFVLGAWHFENPGNYFVPVSVLNQLRRQVAEDIARQAGIQRRQHMADIQAGLAESNSVWPPGDASSWTLKFDSGELAADMASFCRENDMEMIVELDGLPVEGIADTVGRLDKQGGGRLRIGLPLITRARESAQLDAKISALMQAGWRRWEVKGLDAWPRLGAVPPGERDWTSDWTLYALNTQAIRQWLELGVTRATLSPEDEGQNIKTLLASHGDRLTVLVYEDTPLFISDHCIRSEALADCAGCSAGKCHSLPLRSSHDDSVEAVIRAGRTWLVGREAYCLGAVIPELVAAGARHFRADFILKKYTAGQVIPIVEALLRHTAPPHLQTHTGNYRRALL